MTETTEKNPKLFSPLAQFGGAKPPAPDWFNKAMNVAPERRMIPIEGAKIETLIWGDLGKPGLLLLHGNGAHAGWWRFIAPYFAENYRIAALSWSGMGSSQWRKEYSLDLFVAETLGVAEAAGLFAGPVKPIFVGHSFGSFPLVATAHRHGERLRGMCIVDSPFFTDARREQRRKERGDDRRRPRGLRPHRIYPSLEAALARFRLAPSQPCDNLYIADMIAREALHEVPTEDGKRTGWTWKFDPYLWQNFQMENQSANLSHLRCPSALMRGGLSTLMQAEDAAHTISLMVPGSPFIDIPEAYHHVMIDQPLAFVAALNGLLAGWPA